MRVEIKDGKVVCELINKNHDFLADCGSLFDGYYGFGYLKMIEVKTKDRDHDVLGFFKYLYYIVSAAQRYEVEVASEVYELLSDYQTAAEEIETRWKMQDEDYAKREKWQKLCKNGCDGCHYLCMDGDDYRCYATKALLPEKNCPQTGYKIVWRAFPSDECPYKAEQIEEGDKLYEEYKERQILNQF
jgi:hypothetical protein